MYGTPPNVVIVGTRLPSATPIAVRNRTGETMVPKSVPRQTRRYTKSECSSLRWPGKRNAR